MIDLKLKFILVIVFSLAACSKEEDASAPEKIVANIDITSKKEPISPYMYGMFLEHLGNAHVGDLIDDGISAEILDDRKFFYPVDFRAEQVPLNKKDSVNQWVPVNSQEAVMMDSVNAYVGVHSPKIRTTTSSTEGIAQAGLAVLANKKYTGRIVLAGSPGVTINVSLIWGDAPAQRAAFRISKLTNQYTKYNFTLESRERSNNARLEITGSGDGTFSIGAVSLMPEDHIHGFRPEVIRLLKDLNSGLYRWGGNMSSGYDWRDGVGDPDQRPPRYEYAWEALESNDVGTHELMKFAELINVELALTVNAGLGDANSAAQWVEYVNGSTETKMGKWRMQNGHPEPFGVRFWCVGNESYGWWQLGHTDLKNHIIKHNMFAEKMLEVDPSIKLIASGASLEEMTVTGSAFYLTGKIAAAYDSASDWSGGLLRHGRNIDYMSEHFYCAVDQKFDLTKGKYVNMDEPLVDWTRRPANRVRAKAQHYNEYHKRIPGSKRVPVYIDEWAYWTNWVHPLPTLGVTIGYARALHEMFRNTELIKMSGFTFGTSCISFTDTEAVYNASGLFFKLYQSQFGTIPVQVSGNSPQPAPKFPVGGDQPVVNAGGDTYPLDMVAALTSDQKALTVALVNPTETGQKINLQLNGLKISGKIKKWTISGTSASTRNIAGYPPQVTVKETTFDNTEELVIEPASINILRYELQ